MTSLLFAVAIISAATLSYEILLMRLFAIVQWHHFAYMIISVALLGFGASGTFLALARDWIKPRFRGAFLSNAVLFAIAVPGSFALAQRIPFNPLELLWSPSHPLRLLALYLLLMVPFFCAANCIALTFMTFPDRIPRVYRYNLIGSGLGALSIVPALYALSPTNCLKLAGALGFLAAALAVKDRSRVAARTKALLFILAAGLSPLLWPPGWISPRPSQFKGLSQALSVKDAEVVQGLSGPLGELSVVESPTVPFRHAPGLSLKTPVLLPPQLGLFADGESLGVITHYDGFRKPLAYLDYQSAALPYHLLEAPHVLILGAGGGEEILRALTLGARRIDAVELNPQVVELVSRRFSDFSGDPYNMASVRVHISEGRGFVEATGERYDLIQLSLLDAFGASTAGLHALRESYLYTVEALESYMGRLQEGGLLAITRWLRLPPRDSLKLFASAVAALKSSGAAEPSGQIALIRSFRTTTLLVKNGVFTKEEILSLRSFCEARSFDTAYYPGMQVTDANRFNLLEGPQLFSGAKALLGPEAGAFLDRYKFNITPATDDRPYFHDFVKWRTLLEIIALRGRGGLPLVEWGYLVLIATLLQAAVAGGVLILFPLRWLPRGLPSGGTKGRVAIYFLALGLAFLFIEIAFIQRFTLFLSHPLYAVSVVLAAFLIFAGLGSGTAGRLPASLNRSAGATVALIVTAIAILSIAYLLLLPELFRVWMPLDDPVKIFLSILLIAPLASLMGIPFPLGLASISRTSPALIPWAWGVNGCASVLSAVLATFLAIHIGFSGVVLLALAIYAGAAAAFPGPRRAR